MTGGHPTGFGAIVVAAGSSTRFGSGSKVLAALNGIPVLRYSIDLFTRLGADRIVVVLGEDTYSAGKALVREIGSSTIAICRGGETRSDSVRAGLAALPATALLVAIHDAARPLATDALARRVIDEAARTGAAVPAAPVTDTVVAVADDGRIDRALDRSSLRAVQTPQVFRRDWLEECLARPSTFTDESSALRNAGYPVTVVDGDPLNIKITWPLDLALAEVIARHQEGS